MKRFIVSMILILSIGSANADNLFDYNNPFPQTSPQAMNNIYESEPAAMQKEEKKAKRFFFKNKTEEPKELKQLPKLPVYPAVHEGVPSNGDYYLFTTP